MIIKFGIILSAEMEITNEGQNNLLQTELVMQKYNLEEAMEVLGGNDFDRE